jgi:hypothetical protein
VSVTRKAPAIRARSDIGVFGGARRL